MPDDTDPPLPIVTIGFIAVLFLIFGIEQGAARLYVDATSVDPSDLLAFGALNPDLVGICGEWWRLATATLLHANLLHIALNAVALFFAGRFIELHLGGTTVTGVWALGALAGAIGSYLIGGPDRIAVGASGGIMALIAAALLLCWKLPPEADTISGQSLFARILVPSLIPTQSGTDYAGHFGGAIMGAVLALLLADIAYLARDSLHRRVVGVGATAVFVGIALFGTVQLVRAAPAFDPHARYKDRLPAYVPEDVEFPPEAEMRDLIQTYPQDADVRMHLAVALYNAGKPADAEREALTALRQARHYNPPSYSLFIRSDLRSLIALGELAAGNRGKARRLIQPVCSEFELTFAQHLKLTPEARSLCP